MATYKEINGRKIEYLASDPPAPYAGQVWYNSSSQSLKVSKGVAGSGWISQPNMNTGGNYNAGCGSTTAALASGGLSGGTPNTETWNGSAWTTGNNNPAPPTTNLFGRAMAGTSTAAVTAGGRSPPATNISETYNGSWTSNPTINTSRSFFKGAGTSTSAIVAGGALPNPQTNVSESWNGSSWTNTPSLNTARQGAGAVGASNTSALCIGGIRPGPGADPTGGPGTMVESYNGSWTTLPAALNNKGAGRAAGGTITSCLAWGNTGRYTESWNGSSWTSVAAYTTGGSADSGASGSSNTSSLMFSGTPPRTRQTEEFAPTGGTFVVTTS